MSGDVQPRKRKDKKKAKRDSLDRRSEGEIFTRKQGLQDDEEVKESHHGVHAEKMGKDDFHLHVQSDHETGGHWCAKLFFFSLMAILFGIVGLIILENRGSSDLDTPLSESRFSEYFEGWVDEHRQAHDDHHSPSTGLDDHNAEPFEEEEDHSEPADEEHNISEDHDDEEDEDEQQDENVEGDDENEADEESNADENDDDNEDDIEPEVSKIDMSSQSARNKREVEQEDKDDDEGFEDDDNDNVDDNDTGGTNEVDDDDNVPNTPDDNDDDDDDDVPFEESSTNKGEIVEKSEKQVVSESLASKQLENVNQIKGEDSSDNNDVITRASPSKVQSKDDDDFDDADESLEKVVDNDAGEELHLRKKAEQEELAARAAAAVEEEVESAPLAVKIAVGLALAFVARLVLVKKSQPSKPDEPIDGSPTVKRRFTMISAEDDIPVENQELSDEELDEEYSEEEEDEEDDPELQYSEEAEEDVDNDNDRIEKYVPETFEQLNAMFRAKHAEPTKASNNEKPVEARTVAPTETIPKTSTIPLVAKDEPKKVIVDETPKVSFDTSTTLPNIYQRERGFQFLQEDKSDDVHDGGDDGEEEDEEIDDEEDMELDEEEIYSGSEEDADEEISDVDDDELMRRLEAKYGKLPERKYDSEEEDLDEQSWTKVRGPQAYLDDDSYIDEEMRRANEELFNDNLKSALHIYEVLTFKFPEHPGALYGKAKVLDRLSTKYHSNEFLNDAIKTYQAVINLGDKVNDEMFREAGERCLERMRFRGMLAQAVPIHRKLIRRFSDDPAVRNQLAVTYLLQNRYEEAKYILHHTLMRWRSDGFAQAHYGFILKVHNNDLKTAVSLLREGIASGANGTQDGRFYFTLGDALTRLGETKEALEIYRKGAELKLFPSVYQRSLYNVDGLKAQPIWTPEETTFEKHFEVLQRNWELIRKEGLAALNVHGLYMDEAESLKDKGDWKQLELFARGYRIEKNCAKTPLTCNIIETFPAARMCKRGQVKFSIMHAGTHVWPHCGPTNCRLRAHLGLVVPDGTKLRVAKEERTWKAGEWLIFDDSFEHEVWHNGTSPRLVLIVDVWHPELTEAQRDNLSRI